MKNFLNPYLNWFIRQSKWLFPLYAISIFVIASSILWLAYENGELLPLYSEGITVFFGMVIFSLLIIQLGFSAPSSSHVSFDRITQIGLIWIFGSASAALINALASLTYPIFNSKLKKKKIRQACLNSLHDFGMFALCIYFSGKIYQSLGGDIPLKSMTLHSVVLVAVMFLSMQVLNGILLFLKKLISAGYVIEKPDWVVHQIEFAATMIALLFALIYMNNGKLITSLFLVFLMAAIFSAKYLNKMTWALGLKVEQVVTLSNITKAISSTFLLSDVAQEIHKECSRIFQFNYFYFGVVNQKTGAIEPQLVCHHQDEPLQRFEDDSENANPLLSFILNNNQDLFIESFSELSERKKNSLKKVMKDSGSFIGVSIYFNGDFLGIIALGNDVDGAFTRSDYEFIQALANHVGVVIQNASLFRQLEERKEELEHKVVYRTAQIEEQKNALAKLNATLETANQRKEELLITLQETATELDRQCRQDALTGLYNRRHVDDYLDRELERIRRNGGLFSIALLDIDFFKRVNDDFSHSIGDIALKTVGDILMAHVRVVDTVARIGGEEILICLPDTHMKEALVLCERLRHAIQNYNWDAVASGLKLTASLGVAEFDATLSMAELIQRSDEKLYQAKHSGRNQVCS